MLPGAVVDPDEGVDVVIRELVWTSSEGGRVEREELSWR